MLLLNLCRCIISNVWLHMGLHNSLCFRSELQLTSTYLGIVYILENLTDSKCEGNCSRTVRECESIPSHCDTHDVHDGLPTWGSD